MRTITSILLLTALCGCGHGPHDHGLIRVAPPVHAEESTSGDRPGIAPPLANGEQARAPAAEAAPHPLAGLEPEAPPRRDVRGAVQETNGELQDALFEYDRSAVGDAALAALRHDAALLLPLLREFPDLRVTVEGHCDERGSAQYNLGLGDERARQAAGILHQLGLPPQQLSIVSYGKERPRCVEERESCWRLNRRVHLSVGAGDSMAPSE